MRICLLSYRGNPYSGGQGIYLYHLTRHLAGLGHQVEVIVGAPYPRDLTPWARVHRIANLNLWGRYRREWLPPERPLQLFHPLNLFEFGLTRLRFFPEPFTFSLRALALLTGLLRRRHFDVLHDVQSLGFGNLAMMAFGVPMVTTVHHPLTIDQREAFARDRTFEELYHTAVFFPVAMQGLVIRRLHRVLTTSQAGREAIARDFRVPPERISVVPGGLDTEFFRPPADQAQPVHPRDSRQEPLPVLLFVGNTDDWKKGGHFLLHALARLPAGVTLRIVDDAPPAKRLLADQARQLGLEARVRFLGKLNDTALREEYRRCTLLVQPSLYEGFGLPAAEAMSCGTPVVATAVGAVPEVVTPETGVLVPPGDPEAMAAGILSLLDDPERRKAMGRAGRMWMTRRFEWRVAAEKTVEVYRQVIAQHGAWRLPAHPGRAGARAGVHKDGMPGAS
ncbi:MAG: glycosyltransferase family 4 protein [bacterium]